MALLQCSFYSYSLQLSTSITAILPQRSEIDIMMKGGDRRYQTLWLLHGFSDDHSIWQRRTSIERYVDPLGLAVIMPSVDHSFYTNMVNGKAYWTYISEELPEIVRSIFPLSPDRKDNFVAGLSMGGYGAFKLVLSFPDRYTAGASLSGALDINQVVKGNDPEWGKLMRQIFGNLRAVKNSSHDLFYLAKQVAESIQEKPRIYLCCGQQDFLYADNQRFREFAEQLRLDLTYDEGPGEHEWGYWDRQIQKVLDWLPLRRMDDYLGLINMESLTDKNLIEKATVLKSTFAVDPLTRQGQPVEFKILRVHQAEITNLCQQLAKSMLPDFLNYFVNENHLVATFKGKTFQLNKRDRSTWGDMVVYGKSMKIPPEISLNLPLDIGRLF